MSENKLVGSLVLRTIDIDSTRAAPTTTGVDFSLWCNCISVDDFLNSHHPRPWCNASQTPLILRKISANQFLVSRLRKISAPSFPRPLCDVFFVFSFSLIFLWCTYFFVILYQDIFWYSFFKSFFRYSYIFFRYSHAPI